MSSKNRIQNNNGNEISFQKRKNFFHNDELKSNSHFELFVMSNVNLPPPLNKIKYTSKKI